MRFFARHVGLFYTKNGAPIKINKKGMFDMWALLKLRHTTLYIEFEAKSGQAVKSKEQKQWGKFLDTMGVYHFEIRDNNIEELKKNLHRLIGSVQV